MFVKVNINVREQCEGSAFIRPFFYGILIVLSFLCFIPLAHATPVISSVSFVSVGNETELEIHLSQKVPYRVFSLASPYRLVIDLPRINWHTIESNHIPLSGNVKTLRTGFFRVGVFRLVLDLKKPVKITQNFLQKDGKGFSLSLTLTSATPKQFAKGQMFASEKWNNYIASIDNTYKVVDKAVKKVKSHEKAKKIVFLDPGHGGIDPGAMSSSNRREKNIALAIAKVVKKRLEATGKFLVYMSRSTDTYIPLRQRYKKAEKAKADLFISLHTDSEEEGRYRGATVYTLSTNASDKVAATLATKENKSDIIAGESLASLSDDVQNILIDMNMEVNAEESRNFASRLISHLKRSKVRMVERPARHAGFAVLKSPRMASVLFEMGFISNKSDEILLMSKGYRSKLAIAITQATVEFLFPRQ